MPRQSDTMRSQWNQSIPVLGDLTIVEYARSPLRVLHTTRSWSVYYAYVHYIVQQCIIPSSAVWCGVRSSPEKSKKNIMNLEIVSRRTSNTRIQSVLKRSHETAQRVTSIWVSVHDVWRSLTILSWRAQKRIFGVQLAATDGQIVQC